MLMKVETNRGRSAAAQSGAGPATAPGGVHQRGGGRRLTGTPAFYLLASMIVSLLASSSAPTPLYAIYQARWGFSPITITVVFGVYAVSVLVALLTLGKLSDHVGRRPMLLTAVLVQVAAMVVFITAGGVPELLIARILQGLSTGAALGAIGAGMLDIDPKRGTLANAVSPGIGNGAGAMLSALLVRYLPAPTHLIYFVLLGVFLLQGLGFLLMRETASPEPGALASLKPEITLPRVVRGPLLAAVPVLVAVWAQAGFYGGLGPSLVSAFTNSPAVILGGLTLFVASGMTTIVVFAVQKAQPRMVMVIGIAAIIAGAVVTLVALSASSLALLFVSILIAGVAIGAGFQGAIRTVVPLVQAHERSGVLSLLYIILYLGLGVPVVITGFLAVHGQGLFGATREYAAALIVLGVLALIGLLRTRSPRRAGDMH
jgi:MFS family permease